MNYLVFMAFDCLFHYLFITGSRVLSMLFVRGTQGLIFVLVSNGFVKRTAFLGLTNYGQVNFGYVFIVGKPAVGDTFEANTKICELQGACGTADVYTPVACEVIKVNEKLDKHPSLVNSSPESEGWMVQIKMTGALVGLMDRAAYEQYISQWNTFFSSESWQDVRTKLLRPFQLRANMLCD